DIITDGKRVLTIRNGHPILSRITGSGCMLSCLCAAFCAADPKRILEASAAAVAAMGHCGERAAAGTGFAGTAVTGTATFRTALIDRLSRITGSELAQGVLCEESA
ncbi:MAG TPA: hydroxyethylthiazole kinase, partial [Treponemataceae bacterium]|nr:hydroxyethylthiazole kinase [Treponemataceae bacterium]